MTNEEYLILKSQLSITHNEDVIKHWLVSSDKVKSERQDIVDIIYNLAQNLTRLSDAGAILQRVVPSDEEERVRLIKIIDGLRCMQEIIFVKITEARY